MNFRLKKALVGLLALVMAFAVLPPAYGASGLVTGEFVFGYGGDTYYSSANAIDLEMKSSDSVIAAVNYACLNIDCVGGEVKVVFPTNVIISNVVYSSLDFNTMVNTNNEMVFPMKDLAAGASGQITFTATMPGLTLADNYLVEANVYTSTENGASNNSLKDSFSFNLLSGSGSSVTAQILAGGAPDGVTKYSVAACNIVDTGKGGIQINSGSTLVVQLPSIAANVTASGGVYDASTNTITYSITNPVNPNGCAVYAFDAWYFSPAAIGQSFTVDSSWTGAFADDNLSIPLGTFSLAQELDAPQGGGNGTKQGSGPRGPYLDPMHDAAGGIGDKVGWSYSIINTGNLTWNTLTIVDEMADGFITEKITVANKSGTGTLQIKTLFGADGAQGTSDDTDYIDIGQVPAGGATFELMEDNLINGAPLDPSDRVTEIRAVSHGWQVLDSAVAMSIAGKIAPTWNSGVQIIPNEEYLENVINATVETDASTFSLPTSVAEIDVDIPVMAGTVFGGWRNMSWTEPWTAGNDTWPYLSNYNWSPHIDNNPSDGAIDDAERYQWMEFTLVVVDLDVAEPVLAVTLPKKVSFVEYVSCSVVRCNKIEGAELRTDYPGGYASMPKVNLAKIEDYDGQGGTLLRFKLAGDPVLLAGGSWSIWVKVKLNPGLLGVVNMQGHGSAAAGVMQCRPHSVQVEDIFDFDGDGMSDDTVCSFTAGIPMPIISAGSVSASVKGSWDTTYAPIGNPGYSSPGANDTLRAIFQNSGTTGLTDTKIATLFARPGDDGVVTSAARNSATDTFPMYLRGRPVVSGATFSYTPSVLWTTVANPCLAEVGSWNPSGCVDPGWTDWDVTAPTDPNLVTAIVVDFDSNVSLPGDEWVVEFPTTTPASGSSESEFAIQSSEDDPSSYEYAKSSFGFITTPFDLGTQSAGLPLSKSESTTVTLFMPSPNGPNAAPVPLPYSSIGSKGQTQSVTLNIPSSGSVTLLDASGNETNTVTVANVGTYVLDPDTGVVTFTPRPSYLGWPTGVPYRVYNYFDLSGDSIYRPRVIVGTASAAPLTSTADGPTQQNSGLVPAAGSVTKLINNSLNEVTTLTIAGEGTFSIDPTTQELLFTPVNGFFGTSTVTYKVIASDGSTATSTYTATVTDPGIDAVASPLTSTADDFSQQNAAFTPPVGSTVKLIDGDGNEVDSLTIAGEGTFTIDPDTQNLLFTPISGFIGTAVANYRVIAENGSEADSTYSATITNLADPDNAVANPIVSYGDDRHVHIPEFNPLVGSTTKLLDGNNNEVMTLAIPNVGVFSVDVLTQKIIFTPVVGFDGNIFVNYRVIAENGSIAESTYTAHVTKFVSSGSGLDGDGGSDGGDDGTDGDGGGDGDGGSDGDDGNTTTYKLKRKVIWLYFDELSKKLTVETLKKLSALPSRIQSAKVFGFVQGKIPPTNHFKLSKARATEVAKWLKQNILVVNEVDQFPKQISKFTDWRGRSVKLVVWYKVKVKD